MTELQSSQNKRSRTVLEVEVPHDDQDDHQSTVSTSNTEPSTPPSPGSHARSHNSSSQGSCKLKIDEDALKKDLLILSTYVKEDLYYGVKFFYDPKKDLVRRGRVFNHFYKICRKRLEGVKDYDNDREKEWYISHLWQTATEDRIQQDSLSLKRSSVYTVMQNRFFVSGFAEGFVLVHSNICQLTTVSIVNADFM